jgi:hypothetical protein
MTGLQKFSITALALLIVGGIYLASTSFGGTTIGLTLTSNKALNQGLTHHWTFDEAGISTSTVYDVVGSVDGTVTATTTSGGGGATTTSTSTYSTAISTTWTSPANATWVTVKAWGAGGAGASGLNRGGGSGGGGAYAESSFAVTGDTGYAIVVGSGGKGNNNFSLNGETGSSTTFDSTTVVAAGGVGGDGGIAQNEPLGGAGGSVADSTGDIEYAGGDGGNGYYTPDIGGGGGGAAGPHGAGGDGEDAITSSPDGGDGGTADNGSGGAGGAGGVGTVGADGTDDFTNGGGGAGGPANDAPGSDGGAPGGGGSGSETTGGDGADGQLIIVAEWWESGGGPGTTTRPIAETGRIGQGYKVSGSGEYIDFGNAGSGNKTVAFWVKFSGSTDSQTILNLDGTDHIETNGSNDVVATSFPAATVYVNGSTGSANIARAGEWYHVVITDSTGVNASSLEIGRLGSDTGAFVIDDLRLYDTELSAGDIKRLYDLGNTTYISATVTSNPDLENGLVGHWTFDGTDMDWGDTAAEVRDRSGNDNHGNATTSMSAIASPTFGVLGQGMRFDGAADIVTIPSNTSIDDLHAVTYCAWVYPESWGESSEGTIFYKSADDCGNRYALYLVNSGYTASFASSFACYGTTDPWSIAANNSLSLGTWAHLCATFDDSGDDYIHLYKDGTEVVSYELYTQHVGATNADTGYDLIIGADESADYAFDGVIDDVRIYDRALSGAEIKRLYELGATTRINTTINSNPDLESGLVGHWTFDGYDVDWGSASAEVLDISGNDNHGDATTTMTAKLSPTKGAMGQAMYFNGSDDIIEVASTADLKPSAVTLATWAFKPATTTDVFQVFLAKQLGTGQDNSYAIFMDKDDTHIDYFSDGVRLTSSTTMPLGEWVHIVATQDTTNKRIYINGELKNTAAGATLSYDDNPVTIGGDNDDTDDAPEWSIHGSLDDVRIYNRVLEADEVKRLYELGR